MDVVRAVGASQGDVFAMIEPLSIEVSRGAHEENSG